MPPHSVWRRWAAASRRHDGIGARIQAVTVQQVPQETLEQLEILDAQILEELDLQEDEAALEIQVILEEQE